MLLKNIFRVVGEGAGGDGGISSEAYLVRRNGIQGNCLILTTSMIDHKKRTKPQLFKESASSISSWNKIALFNATMITIYLLRRGAKIWNLKAWLYLPSQRITVSYFPSGEWREYQRFKGQFQRFSLMNLGITTEEVVAFRRKAYRV